MSIMYPKHHRPLFSGRSGTSILASWRIGPSIVTECASGEHCLTSVDETIFVSMLFRIRNLPG